MFNHGRMTVTIEVVEIALAVVTRRIDLAPVNLAKTYQALDRGTAGTSMAVGPWLK